MHTGRLSAVVVAVAVLVACSEATPAPPVDRTAAIPADATKMTPADDPVPPIMHSADWDDPIPLAGPINTAGAEDSPFVTADGEALYFWFTPDSSIPAEGQLGDGVTGIWVSHREGDAWGEPSRVWLSGRDEAVLDGCAFVSGDTMWFCTVRAGNRRSIDIFTAKNDDGAWTGWTSAGEPLNVEYLVGELHLSADGTALYYHSDRPGGLGGLDIWVTRLVGDEWQPPENVTAVNTGGADGWPALSPDGEELWITRVEGGSPGLFRSVRTPDGWSTPELIVSQFAGEATLDRDGNLYFTHHFYGEGPIEADIYVARRR